MNITLTMTITSSCPVHPKAGTLQDNAHAYLLIRHRIGSGDY